MGRLGRGPEAELFERYNARLRPRFRVVELADGRGNSNEIKRREAAALLAAVPAGALVVALDLAGQPVDSVELSGLIGRWMADGRPICFVVGGAEGLDATVLERADSMLSLGRMTWPHLLARVMLAEQLYRAQAIAAGHPYHRAGRP